MKDISILIAEDEEEIADLIAILLEKEGYHVYKVSDGQEAVRAVETQSFDLLILDIMMPKMDGYEVTRRIREQHNMPIIFLSAKTSDFDKVQGLVIGADDYNSVTLCSSGEITNPPWDARRIIKLVVNM